MQSRQTDVECHTNYFCLTIADALHLTIEHIYPADQPTLCLAMPQTVPPSLLHVSNQDFVYSDSPSSVQ